MKRGMLFDYLVIPYFIYFLLHAEELIFCFHSFLLIAILIFFNQWWQIIKQNAVLSTKKSRCKRVMMNEWLIMSGLISSIAGSKVYWSAHSTAFTATRIQFPKESQFLLKHIITILMRKAKYAFKASPSLFHHWICNTFIHSLLSLSSDRYKALLFWLSISKCIKHYPISILHNWQMVPNPHEDPTILLTPSPLFLSQILSNTPQPCSFCCLVSLAKCVIMSHLMY